MRLSTCFTLVLAHLSGLAVALNNGTVLNDEIKTFVTKVLADWSSPAGIAVAVVRQDGHGGWRVETQGYGNAKVDGTPVDADTLFAIGSESKLFDIMATGLLISNESLATPITWTTKVASILPEWELMDPVASSTSSIIDLMSHRTGMPRHDIMYGFNDTVPDIIKRMKYLKPSTEFRETFQYCNLMYTVLSYLPTVLLPSQPTLAAYAQEHIFDPLGMNSTTYSFVCANASGKLADSFGREGDTTQNPLTRNITHAMPYWFQAGSEDEGNFASGPGGLISSINDLTIWLKMLLSNGLNPSTNFTLVSSDVLDMVTSGITIYPFVTDDYPELSVSTYGGGQYRSSYRGHNLIEHGGDIQGFHSIITRFPSDGAGMIILSNDEFSDIRDIIRYRILDELFELQPVDWNTRFEQAEIESASAVASLVSTPRPANATAPTVADFPSLAGNYTNLGYTSVELCLIVPAPVSASDACIALASTLNASFSSLIDPQVPTLAFTWDHLASQYMKLVHFDRDFFNLTGWTGMPTDLTNPASPMWAYDAGLTGSLVQFGESSSANGTIGFGFLGGIWGAGDGVPDPQGTTTEEMSEVWFEKE